MNMGDGTSPVIAAYLLPQTAGLDHFRALKKREPPPKRIRASARLLNLGHHGAFWWGPEKIAASRTLSQTHIGSLGRMFGVSASFKNAMRNPWPRDAPPLLRLSARAF